MTNEEREELKSTTFIADVIKETVPPIIRVTGVITDDFLTKMQDAGLDEDFDFIEFFGEAVCDAVTKSTTK